jgi:hypothetical protein
LEWSPAIHSLTQTRPEYKDGLLPAGLQEKNGGVMMAQPRQLTRRIAGVLRSRLPETQLEKAPDPRHKQGQRWKKLGVLLKVVVVGLMAARKGLLETEALIAEMSLSMQRMLGIPRRVPDTTLRNTLIKLSPDDLRHCLHAQIKAAHRRKALEPLGLPFGIVAIDGKTTALPDWEESRTEKKDWDEWNDEYAQQHVHSKSGISYRLMRTNTCSLVSSRAKVCIDGVPIPAKTNEMGHFLATVKDLVEVYGRSQLFKMVSTDSGCCSEANGRALVNDYHLDYLFQIKGDQPTLFEEAKRLLGRLGPGQASAKTVDVVGSTTVTRRLYLTVELAGYLDWEHLQTTLRVESETRTIETDEIVEQEDRYFISSLASERLSCSQWLLSVRSHWAVENQCHHTWDTAFEEDKKPWIESHPKGMVAVLILRRLAYNMLTLYRSVTQRSEERRLTPWKDLMRWVYNTLIAANAGDLAGLRSRKAVDTESI